MTAPFLPDPGGVRGPTAGSDCDLPYRSVRPLCERISLSAEPTGFLWLRGPSLLRPLLFLLLLLAEPGADRLPRPREPLRHAGRGQEGQPFCQGPPAPVKWETGSHHPTAGGGCVGQGRSSTWDWEGLVLQAGLAARRAFPVSEGW